MIVTNWGGLLSRFFMTLRQGRFYWLMGRRRFGRRFFKTFCGPARNPEVLIIYIATIYVGSFTEWSRFSNRPGPLLNNFSRVGIFKG